MKKIKKQKFDGFTIIELIVVIAIIAVLSSIVFFSVNKYIQRAKDAKVKNDFREIEKAAILDYIKCGNWAPDRCPGEPPRFANPSFNSSCGGLDCDDPEIFYPGSNDAFDASFYCKDCKYDWENWGEDCVGITLRDLRRGGVILDSFFIIEKTNCL